MGDNEISNLNGWDSKKVQDFTDLQNEIAGHDTGRTERFLPNNGAEDGTSSNRDKKNHRETLTASS